MSSFSSNPWFWVALGLTWVVSLLSVHRWGIMRGVKAYGEYQSWIEPWLDRWVKTNDQYVSDMAHAALADDATAQQQNVHLIADNRRLRKKVFRLAHKYGAAARALKQKPYLDRLDRLIYDCGVLLEKIHGRGS